MKAVYLIVRKEKHIDDKYWLCKVKKDALTIAEEVADFWLSHYTEENNEIVTEPVSDQIFYRGTANEGFEVFVKPINLRESGQTDEKYSN